MKTTEIEKGIFITVIEQEDINLAIQRELERKKLKEKELRELFLSPSNQRVLLSEEVPF